MLDVRLILAKDWSLLSAIAVAALVILSMLFFYRRIAATVPRQCLVQLLALRTAAMAALLLCLFQPVLSYQRKLVTKPTLICLVDTSRSMSVRDFPNLPDRLERVKKAVLRGDGLAEKLARNFDLVWYSFADVAAPIAWPEGMEKCQPTGEATNLAAAVKVALGARDKTAIAGVIPFSDGIDNSGADVVERLSEEGLPVYPVGVGTRLREQSNFRDIHVVGIDANRTMALKNANEINVLVEAMGYPDRKVPVILKEDEKEIARESLTLDNKEGTQTITLKYTPDRLGQFRLTASIPVDPAERNTENNYTTFPIVVRDAKIRVLHVEGRPRSEYKFLRRAIEFDPNIESLSFVRMDEGVFLRQGGIEDAKFEGMPRKKEDLENFHVVILGNLDRSYLSDGQLKLLEEGVRNGMGFLMIGGSESFGPGGYGGTPVEALLPVSCGSRDMGQEKTPFLMQITPEGEEHPVFAGCQKFFPTQKRAAEQALPELQGCVMVGGVKAGATVLAVDPEKKIKGEPIPVLAVQSYGAGRSAAFTADTTWKWYFKMRALGRASPYFKFWGQLVRWLAGREKTERSQEPGVFVYSDKSLYLPSERVSVTALVTDTDGQATNLAKVTAAITIKDETHNLPLHPIAGRTGEYGADYKVERPGTYALKVDAEQEKRKLGEARVTFQVGQPNLEFDRLDIDEDMMRKLAAATGGRYFSLVTSRDLPEHLEDRLSEKQERTERRLPQTALFLLFLLLMTSEWVIRKSNKLS
ncbi:MAG: glutamine amidotransferase [Planctomycetota bacterium]